MVRPYAGYGKRKTGSYVAKAGRVAKRSRIYDLVAARRRSAGRWRNRNIRYGGYLGIEYKYYDTARANMNMVSTTAGAELDPAANDSCFNAIALGDGESNRDGRKCVVKSIQIRGMLHASGVADAADAPPGICCRLVLVQDTQTNGAQLNSEDVLRDVAFTDCFSMRNLQYSKRFKVLWDRTLVIRPGPASTDGANTCSCNYIPTPFKVFKTLNMPVTFKGDAADIANIVDNSLHLIGIADVTTATPRISYQARVRFVG